jgi:predicted MPP superfamily phosphohydrolase
MTPGCALFLLVGWVGHAYLWTAVLNILYARPLPKWFLKPWRLLTGVVIVGYPAFVGLCEWQFGEFEIAPDDGPAPSGYSVVVFVGCLLYLLGCGFFGLIVFPLVTLYRLLRPKPAALVVERTDPLDLWKRLGPAAVGDGKMSWAARLPGTDVFTVDLTHQTLAVPGLPAAWDGLTVLLLSDLHFHGTPSRDWFDALFDHLRSLPEPDLVVMAGDVVDTDEHHAWVGPLLGRLTAREARLAVVGNHDQHHHPDRLRQELAAAGYTVLGSGWREATVRGERCVVVGHEGPWFRPGPDLTNAPTGLFRLCVSHTPDNFPWAARNGCGLTLSGHVHGGQVRLPVVGSIFVPSVYGRRYDCGVFEQPGGVLAVGRGVSGKEPLRVRCRPQLLRLTLTLSPTG